MLRFENLFFCFEQNKNKKQKIEMKKDRRDRREHEE